MSASAPWIACAIDTFDSEMFDNATDGERLAWVCLLFFAKAQGRAGRVQFRVKVFASKYRLKISAVTSMLDKAKSAGAITLDADGAASVINWKKYQDPKYRTRTDLDVDGEKNGNGFSKTPELSPPAPSTQHPAPPTQHPKPSTQHRGKPAGAFAELTSADLKEPAKVEGWVVHQRSKNNPVIIDNVDTRLMVHAAAVKASSDEAAADSPIKLFAWLVADPTRWDQIPARDVEEARRRINSLTRAPPRNGDTPRFKPRKPDTSPT